MPDGKKLGYKKNFINKEFYEDIILPGLEKVLSDKYKYSDGIDTTEEVEEAVEG